MAREYQNGDGFGYILAFRKKDTSSWTVARIPHVESSRYVYYNDSVTPYSPFEVKIKAYNRRGEGPFSQIAVVHSAEEGESLWKTLTITNSFWGGVHLFGSAAQMISIKYYVLLPSSIFFFLLKSILCIRKKTYDNTNRRATI